MPQVPYSPEAFPRLGALPNIAHQNFQIDPEAFGAARGRALARLGSQVEQSADAAFHEVAKWRELDNTGVSADIETQAMTNVAKIEEDMTSRSGKDAKDAWPGAIEALKAAREEALAQAPNAAVRRQIELSLARTVALSSMRIAHHVGTEERNYAKQSIISARTLAVGQAADGTEVSLKAGLTDADKRTRELGKEMGWDEATTTLKIKEAQGEAWTHYLSAIAQTDPELAWKKFHENKSEIFPNTALQLEPALWNQIITHTAGRIGRDSNGGDSSYFDRVKGKESAGRADAKNPLSSATGLYQFTTGTWDALRKKHPELELTADGRTNAVQQERAIRAFTQDNAAKLSSAGIPSTEKNLYLAHFLGADGAVRFIRGMEKQPDQNAREFVDPGTANANPTIFKQGRSAAAVYELLTGKFKTSLFGTQPATMAEAEESAKVQARAVATELNLEPQRAAELEHKVMEQAKSYHLYDVRVKKEQQLSDDMTVMNRLMTDGVHTVEDALKDPDVQRIWTQAGAAKQELWEKKLNQKNKYEENYSTPEQDEAFTKLIGLAQVNPRAFLDTDFSKSGLSMKQINLLQKEQAKIIKGQAEEFKVMPMVEQLAKLGVFKDTDVKFNSSAGNERLQHFAGAFHELVMQWKVNNGGKMPDLEEQRKIAAQLFQTKTGWFSDSQVFAEDRAKLIETQATLLSEFRQAWTQQYPNKPLPPTSVQLDYIKRKLMKEAKR